MNFCKIQIYICTILNNDTFVKLDICFNALLHIPELTPDCLLLALYFTLDI